MTHQRALRIAAWLILIAIALVTLGPIGLRPTTDLPVNIERGAAFMLAGFLFALAYPRHIWLAVALVFVGAIGLEWLQNLRPDRHGRELDAIAKLAGASIGLGSGWLVSQLGARRSGKATNQALR